jgi:hypothetical protein
MVARFKTAIIITGVLTTKKHSIALFFASHPLK